MNDDKLDDDRFYDICTSTRLASLLQSPYAPTLDEIVKEKRGPTLVIRDFLLPPTPATPTPTALPAPRAPQDELAEVNRLIDTLYFFAILRKKFAILRKLYTVKIA